MICCIVLMFNIETNPKRQQCLLTTIHIHNIFQPVMEVIEMVPSEEPSSSFYPSSTPDVPLALIIQSFIDFFEEVLAAVFTAHAMEMTPELIDFIIKHCL